MPTRIASPQGHQLIHQVMQQKGIAKSNSYWMDRVNEILNEWHQADHSIPASISSPTWRRFHGAKSPIQDFFFEACCQALGLSVEQVIQVTAGEVGSPYTASPDDFSLSDTQTFTWAGCSTPWLIKDGTGEVAYRQDDLVCRYIDTPLELPERLERLRTQISDEQAKRDALGQTHHWNGPRYYLHNFAIERTPHEERPCLTLTFGPSDYYTSLATNQQLILPWIRATYLPGNWDKPVHCFSNSFAVDLCLITSDHYLIITQRSDTVGTLKGVFNISANEALSRSKDHRGGVPDVFNCATRGVKEELGVALGYEDIQFLSFGVDTTFAHWALLGTARLRETKAQLESKRRSGVDDKWENRGIDFIPFTLLDVLHAVQVRSPRWTPVARACIYHTLVFEFGREVTEAAFDRWQQDQLTNPSETK